MEEDPQEMIPVVSVETSEDGTTRRTETTVSLFFMQSHVHISYVVFKYTVKHTVKHFFGFLALYSKNFI